MNYTIRAYSPNTGKETFQDFTDYVAALQFAQMLENVGLIVAMFPNPQKIQFVED